MTQQSIDIVLLHDTRGPLASLSGANRLAAHSAVDRINRSSGLLGLPLRIVEIDSSAPTGSVAQQVADYMAGTADGVIFAACRSNLRQALLSPLDQYGCSMWYTVNYEGLENSPHVIHTGLIANQQISAILDFLQSRHLNTVHLLGTDSGYSHTFNRLFRAVALESGLTVNGTSYIPFDENASFDHHELSIPPTTEAVISSLIGHPGHLRLEKALRNFVTNERPPMVISTIVLENEVKANPQTYAGHFVVGGPFPDSYSKTARDLEAAVEAQLHGAEKSLTTTALNLHASISIWAHAVKYAGSMKQAHWLCAAHRHHADTAAGDWLIQADNHTRRAVSLGVIDAQGGINTIHGRGELTEASPWMGFDSNQRSRAAQRDLLGGLAAEVHKAREAEQRELRRAQQILHLNFLASHTLREPLQSLLTTVNELRGVDSKKDQDVHEYLLGHIKDASSEMNELVVLLMKLSQADGTSKPKLLNLEPLIHRVLEKTRHQNVHATISECPCVEVEAQSLELLLETLLLWRAGAGRPEALNMTIRTRPSQGLIRLFLEDDGPHATTEELSLLNDGVDQELPQPTSCRKLQSALILKSLEHSNVIVRAENRICSGVRIRMDLPAAICRQGCSTQESTSTPTPQATAHAR